MEEKKESQFKYCEYCNSNASCLCFKCNSYFCEQCYKIIHNLRKDPQHKKEIYDPFVPIDLKCPEHPQDRINLFCVDEKGKIKIIYNFNFRNMLCNLLF